MRVSTNRNPQTERFVVGLRERVLDWESASTIGDLYNEYFAQPQVESEYGYYITHHDEAMTYYSKMFATHAKFKEFIEDAVNEETQYLFLYVFLTFPIYRPQAFVKNVERYRHAAAHAHVLTSAQAARRHR